MAIKYVKCKVIRSEMHKVVDNYPEWEVDILEAIHEAVERLGDIVHNVEPPNAEDEYERLKNRYGRSENEDGSRGIPYVATVYGQHNVGISALRRAIEKATVADAPADGSDLLGLATA
jgi:hypothetical protein